VGATLLDGVELIRGRVSSSLEVFPLWLAIAALATIAYPAVVHWAIFAALLAGRLICRKSNRANHRCDNGKQNFSVLFHTGF
jgi:hypothetical protein